MNIEQAIYTELSAVTGLSGKVFPMIAQQDINAPYLTYELNGLARVRTLISNDGLIESPYQLDIFHTSYSSLKALIDLVVAEIKTWERTNLGSTGPYIQVCSFGDQVETYDPDNLLYQGTIDINIAYNAF
jgi:hypothetical protein